MTYSPNRKFSYQPLSRMEEFGTPTKDRIDVNRIKDKTKKKILKNLPSQYSVDAHKKFLLALFQ